MQHLNFFFNVTRIFAYVTVQISTSHNIVTMFQYQNVRTALFPIAQSSLGILAIVINMYFLTNLG